MYCLKLGHGWYFTLSCPDCEKEAKAKKEERVSLFSEVIIYYPPPLLQRPESWASREARKIMGPAPDEIQQNMLGQIEWIGPR